MLFWKKVDLMLQKLYPAKVLFRLFKGWSREAFIPRQD